MIGARLRELRKANRKTQARVAVAIGVSRVMVCHIEKGNRRLTIAQLLALCKLYKVTPNDILTEKPG